jgi:hypothetical protein
MCNLVRRCRGNVCLFLVKLGTTSTEYYKILGTDSFAIYTNPDKALKLAKTLPEEGANVLVCDFTKEEVGDFVGRTSTFVLDPDLSDREQKKCSWQDLPDKNG